MDDDVTNVSILGVQNGADARHRGRIGPNSGTQRVVVIRRGEEDDVNEKWLVVVRRAEEDDNKEKWLGKVIKKKV
jgi:hypothetical protein